MSTCWPDSTFLTCFPARCPKILLLICIHMRPMHSVFLVYIPRCYLELILTIFTSICYLDTFLTIFISICYLESILIIFTSICYFRVEKKSLIVLLFLSFLGCCDSADSRFLVIKSKLPLSIISSCPLIPFIPIDKFSA